MTALTAALAPLFFAAALIYAMAGFGGGSTYLALLMLFAVPFESVRPIALLCNIAVAGGGAWHFARRGYLSLNKILPFIAASIPMAWWGGTIEIGKTAFTLLLGISLSIAAVRMLWIAKAIEPHPGISREKFWILGMAIGAVLGSLAGVIGIGGGIYLAPVLLFLGWADAKETAAAASFFILVNSIAGLMGQAARGFDLDLELALPLLAAVIAGGQIGSRLGAGAIPKIGLQKITGVLILLVSGRLLWGLL